MRIPHLLTAVLTLAMLLTPAMAQTGTGAPDTGRSVPERITPTEPGAPPPPGPSPGATGTVMPGPVPAPDVPPPGPVNPDVAPGTGAAPSPAAPVPDTTPTGEAAEAGENDGDGGWLPWLLVPLALAAAAAYAMRRNSRGQVMASRNGPGGQDSGRK